MTRNTTRVGRRRRVLNEEVLSASNLAARSQASSEPIEPGDTPRYGIGANIENHPQVTSFVPRRLRTLALVGFLGLGIGCTAEIMAHYAETISELVPVVTSAEIKEAFADRLVAWAASVILLSVGAYTRLVYSLRRHRVDDYRGRYRVWRTAGWAALFLSLNSVVGGHELMARVLGHLASDRLVPDNALWWLAPAALFGGWLLFKLVVEVSECRSAMAVYLLASACLVAAGMHSAGWSPAWSADWPDLLSRGLPLGAFTLLLLGSQRFARYVVLDVQGLIVRPEVNNAESPQISLADPAIADPPESSPLIESEVSEWVDGSEGNFDLEAEFDDNPKGRLSKSERKRIRKKNQRRAA